MELAIIFQLSPIFERVYYHVDFIVTLYHGFVLSELILDTTAASESLSLTLYTVLKALDYKVTWFILTHCRDRHLPKGLILVILIF